MFQYNQGTGDKTFKTERERDFGLHWDMTKYRTYDYQLGRFNQVDPLAEVAPQESLSPYQYSFNNPIRYNDPYGDFPWPPPSFIAKGVATVASAKTWFDNASFSTKMEAKATIGVQVGVNVEVGSVPVGANVNLGSAHIASIEFEQQDSDTGPTKTDKFSLFSDETKIEQSVSLGIGVAEVGAEQSFVGNLDEGGGFEDRKAKVSGSIGPLNTEREVEIGSNGSSGKTNNRFSLDFKIGASLLLGGEIKLSIGVTDDKIE